MALNEGSTAWSPSTVNRVSVLTDVHSNTPAAERVAVYLARVSNERDQGGVVRDVETRQFICAGERTPHASPGSPTGPG
jgi:hypothetical protein